MIAIKELRAKNLTEIKKNRFKTTREMAKFLDIQESRLSTLLRGPDKRPIGDMLARKMESKLNLPANYLDNPHTPPNIDLNENNQDQATQGSKDEKIAKLVALLASSNVNIDSVITIVEALSLL